MAVDEIIEIPIVLSEKLLIAGAKCVFWIITRKSLLVIVILIPVFLIEFIKNGSLPGYLLVGLGAIASLVLFAFFLYLQLQRQAIAAFQATKNPNFVWRFDKVGLTADNGEQKMTRDWSAIQRLSRNDDIWVIYYKTKDFSVFPAQDLSSQLKELLCAEIRAAGGTVA